MEKIKVGEYVRTSTGNIGKVYSVCPIITDEAGTYYKYILEINEKLFINDSDNIVKHSPNIIDLIEEGDYVNGEIVECFKKENCDYDIGTQYNAEFDEYYGYNEEEIKTIVTKEMFNQVKYEV